jgi:hypothetical protein
LKNPATHSQLPTNKVKKKGIIRSGEDNYGWFINVYEE